jgi:hypothetical protein
MDIIFLNILYVFIGLVISCAFWVPMIKEEIDDDNPFGVGLNVFFLLVFAVLWPVLVAAGIGFLIIMGVGKLLIRANK